MSAEQVGPAPGARRGTVRGVALGVGRVGAGLVLGALAVPVELLCLLLFGLLLPALLIPAARATVTGWYGLLARGTTALHLRRLVRLLDVAEPRDYPDAGAVRYLLLHWPVGLLGGVILLLLGYGAAFMASWALVGFRPDPGAAPNPLNGALVVLLGMVLCYVAVQGLAGVAGLERTLAARVLRPSEQDRLRRRITELTTSRAEVLAAVNDERRRIERDLHDGLQQRLVALGMVLGRARRGGDPDRSAELLRQAHEESQLALTDLRAVAWRVYPSTLDDLGLAEVLAGLAQRCDVPVELHYELDGRAPRDVEAVAYFVVSEALTNVVKHAAATRAEVYVGKAGEAIIVRVTDDGVGGADETGRGLTGLAGRVAALDGSLSVHSPPGGPTTLRAEL